MLLMETRITRIQNVYSIENNKFFFLNGFNFHIGHTVLKKALKKLSRSN